MKESGMDIDEIILGLGRETDKRLKDRRINTIKALERNPEYPNASRLLAAIEAELMQRKVAKRKEVGPLWWEPHDADEAEFFAYETSNSVIPVASIFKNDTHTATRKDVYVVRVGDADLTGRFSEIAIARQAGSDAWEAGRRQ